jgi:subtilisin family serine protease
MSRNRLFIAVSFGLILVSSVFAQGVSDKYVSDEILVKFDAASAGRRSVEKMSGEGARVMEKLGDIGWHRLTVPAGLSVDEAIARFSKLDGVIAVQPNFYYHLLLTPNDPQFPAGLWGLTKISAPAAWDLSTGSPNVVVADIDTGLRYTHQDIAANVWTNPGETANNCLDDDNNGFVDDYYGWDFRYNDNDPSDDVTGFGGHGTHTAGTIGAVGNNGLGVVGLNWNVRIMAIKIYSPAGTDTTSAMLISAYNYVRMMKNRGVNIRVTNNSYGGCNEACGYDQATKDAIDAMGDAGILNVFAAGNSGTNNDVTPHYPSNYTSPSIVAVAASDVNDNRIFNYGPISVDLGAPGSGILSTISSSDSAYGLKSGTSMATPHVTGAAALLAAYNPNLSVASLKATLMNSVDVIIMPVNWSQFVKSGGRLNVSAALQNQTVCTFNLSTPSITARTKGGYYSVNVSAAQNCDYSIKSNANWIKVAGSDTGSGNSTVNFRVTFNPSISRSGTLTIGGQTFTVTQSRG